MTEDHEPAAPEDEETGPDPFEMIHQALREARQRDELDSEWYVTDFLVVGVAQSFVPEHKGVSLCFQIGPEVDPPPHRVLGLLQYALSRYQHNVQCCLPHTGEDDDEEV